MGIEPMVRVLQTLALPLGDVAVNAGNDTRFRLICQSKTRVFAHGQPIAAARLRDRSTFKTALFCRLFRAD